MKKLKKPESLIRKILEERNIKHNFICNETGISPKIFTGCMEGKRKFKVWEFIAVCNFLQLDFSIFKDCFKSII